MPTKRTKRSQPNDWLSECQNDTEHLAFLEKAGVSSTPYVEAEMMMGSGFELPRLIQHHCNAQAKMNMARANNEAPPTVKPERAIPLGTHVESGQQVNLDIYDMGHTAILGPTKSGKNVAARQIAHGVLTTGRRFDVIGQKGDEILEINLWPRSIYLPIQLEPSNDWAPPGKDRVAYWTAAAEAFAIPKLIAPQTQPEFALILEQMWRSAPNATWLDLERAFKWKSEQPGGRDKHVTAMAAIKSYSVWLGEKATVQTGIDVRREYPHIIYGYIGASLDNIEASLGMYFVREMFEALERGHSRDPRLFIFSPEAQLIYDRSIEYARRGAVSYLLRFFSMADSMGLRLIVALQSPSKVSAPVLGNTSTVIVLCQDSWNEAVFCAELLGLEEEAASELMALPRGVAYVKTPGWTGKVSIHYIDLGAAITPRQAELRFEHEYSRFRCNTTFARKDEVIQIINWQNFVSPDTPPKSAPQPGMHKDHFGFLRNILDHPAFGLKQRYDSLGWGISKGNSILDSLKKACAIRVTQLPSNNPKGGRGRLIAEITPHGRELLETFEGNKAAHQGSAK